MWHDGHARLAGHPLFAACSRAEIRKIHQLGDLVEVEAGKRLLDEDHSAHWCFVVCTGSLRLTRHGRLRGKVGAGESVGHIAILGMGPQPTTVSTDAPSVLFILSRRELINVFYAMRSVRQAILPGVADDEVKFRVRALQAEGRTAWQRVPLRVVRTPTPTHPPHVPHPVAPFRPRRLPAPAPAPAPLVHLTRRAKLVLAAAIAGLAIVGATTYKLPLEVVTAGAPINAVDDVEIEGAPTYRPAGQYLVLSVKVERPTLVGLVRALTRNHEVMRSSRVPHPDPAAHRALFRESQLLALAAAGHGTEAPRVSVAFRHRTLGGPSAGLAYALAIADLLDPVDHSDGRTIAATGELSPAGAVSPVGGLRWKAEAARSAGAALLLAPASELRLLANSGLRVRGVDGFAEAFAYISAN